MKKRMALLLSILIGIQVSAQFKLEGSILNYSGKAGISVNIPLVYGFHKENTIAVPVSPTGKFSITLPVESRKFATLIFQEQFYSLLLTSGKHLTLTLDEKDKKLELISGSALPENRLLQRIDVNESPSFMNESAQSDVGKLSFAALNTTLIQPYFVKRDEKINRINASDISQADKKLMASEVKYITYNYLNDFARTQVNNREVIDSIILSVFDNSIIKPEVFPAGPQYYFFADNYLRYLETKAFLKIKQEKIKPEESIPYFRISFDSANIIVKKYGKPYWRWIGSINNFPDAVTEQYTFQQIVNLYDNKDLRPTTALSDAFKKRFPSSKYNRVIDQRVNTLKELLAQNESDAHIQVVKQEVQSVYDVIKDFKGKVVYLDVWGTWCGPCKEELKHIPALRSAFVNKDVVFVYLDMDDDDRDTVWKEFIKVNGLKGTHFRKNRQTIAPLWKELLADNQDKAEYYPQYFIFDKEGKLAVSKAFRPSDKAVLYQQINTVLSRH
ncbi:TlpA family protein disulfide reductase [Chitinophaga sp. RAB17]|uniref:TlpA family protein disulfide reductase n=1 Tax=Chitinophaga sp. RAB17 TaxID=3233049 RepID=UPI003F8FC0E2